MSMLKTLFLACVTTLLPLSHIACQGGFLNLGASAQQEPAAPLEPAQGFVQVELLEREYSLVFRDQGILNVLETTSLTPRPITTTQDQLLYGIPVWSKDGNYLYDCERNVIRISFDGKVEVLTQSERSREPGWPSIKGWPERYPALGRPRFVEDVLNKRLIYLESTWKPSYCLVALDLSSRILTPLTTGEPVSNVVGWAFDVKSGVMYFADKKSVTKWSPTGQRLASLNTAGKIPSDLLLSPDGARLLIELVGERRNDGCIIVRTSDFQPEVTIDIGHSFEWSNAGDRIAFLHYSEDLNVYTLTTGVQERLIALPPRASDPDWSRGRYYQTPAWSKDDRMIACGLARFGGIGREPHYFEFQTLIIDLEARQFRSIPSYWSSWGDYFAWSPRPRPFMGSPLPRK